MAACAMPLPSKAKLRFNSKHLKKGDPLPSYSGGLRVYNMRYCPYGQRVMLTLLAKGLPHEVVNINLMNKPEWMLTKSPPSGKVPSLEVRENVTISDSTVAVEYLDEVFPQRPLLPRDPERRAHDRILVQNCEPILKLFGELIMSPDSISEQSVAAYRGALATLQSELARRGTPFLGGDVPGYSDYMIWPWFERMLILADSDKEAEISANKFKLLLEYINRMYEDPVVKQYSVPRKVLSQLLQAYKNSQTGTAPDFDVLVDK